jgi:hypothetical protein
MNVDLAELQRSIKLGTKFATKVAIKITMPFMKTSKLQGRSSGPALPDQVEGDVGGLND